MRTFVIGDIHGCYDELIELMEKIGLTENDFLISVGDLVDRGNKSKEVYEYFLNRPHSKVLIGNHERKHINGVLSYAQEIVKVQFGDEYQPFLSWLKTHGYFYETDDAIIVHAALEHDRPLKEQKEEVLCGSTSGERYLEKKYASETYWNDYYNGNKPVIYGHQVVGDLPKIKNNTYGIDTGCCHGNFLTALELPGFVIHQVKAKKDYWKEEQRRWQIPVLKSKNWETMEIVNIKKQLEKLSYIEEEETKAYLHSIRDWVADLEHLLVAIKLKLDEFAQRLLEIHHENFNIEAANYPFKTYLFKSKNHNLTLDDLKKSLNTPIAIIKLAQSLEMEGIPER